MKVFLVLCAFFALAENVFGNESSSLNELLIQKSADGNLETVANLLEKGADVNASNRQLKTPLSVAAAMNHKKVVEFLVEKGASLAVGEAAANAAQGGHLEIVEFLLDKGMNVNAPRVFNNGSILSSAVRGVHLEIVEFLLEKGANVNFADNDGYTALYTASETSVEMVKFLLEHGAEVDAMIWTKSTPLLHAASYGLTDAGELLANAGGDLNARSDHGDTALIRASIMGHAQTVEWLINHGADLFAMNDAGNTVLDIAKQNSRTEMVALLEKYENDAKKASEVSPLAVQDVDVEKDFSSKYVFAVIGIVIVAFVVIFILLAKKHRDKIQ